MKAMITILAAGVLICGLCGSVGMAAAVPPGEGGKVFPLKRQPLPDASHQRLSFSYHNLESMRNVLPGIDGVAAMGTELDLSQAGLGRRQIVLVKNDDQLKHRDRLYVDANGNQRFDPDECYDISRTKDPVRVERSSSNRHYSTVCPVKLTGGKGGPTSTQWIALRAIQYDEQRARIGCAPVTCAMGEVQFGERKTLLGICSASHGLIPLDRGVELADGDDGGGVRMGCQLLLDASGNGQFDRLTLQDMGLENRWLTRLVRSKGVYYALSVAPGGESIRITPTKPKVGKLKIPAEIESASVVGPEMAAIVVSDDKEIELPAGRYSILQYRYLKDGARLRVSGGSPRGVFEVKADQTNTFRVGAPLGLGVTYQSTSPSRDATRRPSQLRFVFKVTDCVGRGIVDCRSSRGNRPPAPRLKIVDQGGKTVLDAAFRYG